MLSRHSPLGARQKSENTHGTRRSASADWRKKGKEEGRKEREAGGELSTELPPG